MKGSEQVMVVACAYRCAAVSFIRDQILYMDGQPAQAIVDRFSRRSDNQITTLEVLAIVVGLSTFGEFLKIEE